MLGVIETIVLVFLYIYEFTEFSRDSDPVGMWPFNNWDQIAVLIDTAVVPGLTPGGLTSGLQKNKVLPPCA